MLKKIKGKLVVSCQALPEEPLHSSFIMARMALAAKQGGASGIRAQGVEDIKEIQKTVDLPIIGIIKKLYPDSDIHITASKQEVCALIETGCEMIAMDATNRKRPNNETVEDLLAMVHKAGKLAMADISTLEEGIAAAKMGFDCVSTTLSGYTPYSKQADGVDVELIQALKESIDTPIIAEGKIHYPENLKQAFDAGAYSAVVGGAITRPLEITQRFVKVLAFTDKKN